MDHPQSRKRRLGVRTALSPTLLATRPSVGDAVNGFTVAAITVPAALGYAVVAGLPPVFGLYAAMTSMIVFGLVGGNRFLILGPDAAFAAIIGATLASVSSVTGQRAPVLAPLLALLVGIGFLVLGALRAGKLASFLSQPLLAGFITGLAITIIVGQIPKILGIPSPSSTTLGKIADIWDGIGEVSWQSLVLGVLTIVLARLLGHLFPRAPIAAGLLVLGLLAVVVLELEDAGVDVVGKIDQGLPALEVPSIRFDDLAALLTGALALCAIGFADGVLQGRNHATRAGDEPTPDRDVMAMGVANVATAFTSGYPVSASASRSSAAAGAGASSTWVSLLGGLVVALVLLVLAPYLENLPIPVLAGVIVAAASRLIRPRELTGLWPHRRAELLVAVVAAVGVILAGVIAGVGVALALSLLQFVFRAANPPSAVLGRLPGRAGWWDVGRMTEAEPVPGVVVWRFEAPLFFANAEAFTTGFEAVLARARSAPAGGVPITTVVLEADGIVSIDATAAGTLRSLFERLAAEGVEVRVAGAHAALREQLSDVDALIPPGRVYKTNDEAVADLTPPRP